MKKMVLRFTLFVSISLIALSVLLLNYFMKQPCNPPKRHRIIPQTAVWSGGCDGGYWFEQVGNRLANNHYRIRIFNDYDGSLELDAEFAQADTCKLANETPHIVDKILLYNGDQIIMKDKYCSLNVSKIINDTENH